jgi:hypothetical protein
MRSTATKKSQKKYYLSKLEWLKGLKSKPCADCGEQYPDFVMDFHHLRDKDFGINHWAVNCYGRAKLQKEVDKCVLLCANCHRHRHYGV